MPKKEYASAYSEYMKENSGANLSSSAIAGIVIGGKWCLKVCISSCVLI